MADDPALAIEALREAMANEERTHDFYVEAAARVTSDKGRSMFAELAEEEVVHMKTVRTQYESLKAGRGWVTAGELTTAHVDITPLEFKRSDLEARVRESTSDIDALVIAAEMENNSFVFYTQQYAQTTEPIAKSLYGALVRAERNHFNIVMTNWETLVHTGYWSA